MADVEDMAEAVGAANQQESQWGKGKMFSFQCVMGRCRRRPAWCCCAQAATNSHRKRVQHAMCNSSKPMSQMGIVVPMEGLYFMLEPELIWNEEKKEC